MWQQILAIGLIGAGVGCVAPPFRILRKLRRQAHRYNTLETPPLVLPKLLVVLPCKGQEDELPYLEDNLRHVLDQDYPDFRVIFAIGNELDIARPILEDLCRRCPRASVTIVEKPLSPSHKLSNQLRALQQLQADDEVLVFMDSDSRPDPETLRRLVAPLTNPRIGATTGFRWYTPTPGQSGAGSWLRAAWNVGGMPFMVEPKYNYAWGGAMAIRRSVFEECGVAEYWGKALSDDLGLSLLVKQAGYLIEFVPTCLIRSPEDLALMQVLEWTTRQTLICRVYNPVMWADLFIGESITLATWVLAAAAMSGGGLLAWTGAVTLLLLVVGRMVYQWQIVGIVRRLAPPLLSPGSTWRLVAFAVPVHFLVLYNSLRSWMTRRLRWRGITYHLASPTQTIVIQN